MFFLAWKHLISRKRQTMFILLGIFFGSAAFVVITGIFLGFQSYLLDQLVNNDAHVRVTSREDFLEAHSLDKAMFPDAVSVQWRVPPSGSKSEVRIENPLGWYTVLSNDTRVVSYSPQMMVDVIFTKGPISHNGRVIGCDADKQTKVTNIKNYMKEGNFEDIDIGGNRIVLGDGLMKKIGALVGDTILVSSGEGPLTPFKIVGRFLTGVRPTDDATGFSSLQDAQTIASLPNQVTDIAIRLSDFQISRRLADDWSVLMPDKVQSWDEINANILNVFTIQNAIRYLVISVILIVAGFGIYNVLSVIVQQKQREIAILRAIGFEPMDVQMLFLYQGLILGVVGAIAGVLIGYFISLGLERIPFSGGPMGGGAGHLVVSFDRLIYIRSFFFGLLCALLASYLPARAAGRMTPIEIIRSGAE